MNGTNTIAAEADVQPGPVPQRRNAMTTTQTTDPPFKLDLEVTTVGGLPALADGKHTVIAFGSGAPLNTCWPTDRERLEYIRDCVNAHAGLFQACKELACLEGTVPNFMGSIFIECARDLAREAIASPQVKP